MEKKEYYLGLDMGTNSIGWAVTDENYNLLKKKGKDLWGIREFDEADTSAERRSHRTSRRRRQREQVRMGLVQSYFADEIQKVDKDFFVRLSNSKYYEEDKDIATKNGVFDDVDYQDADYYQQFPTIFHLRKELIENPEPHDVRLVYLAISNIFKHRGHFLLNGVNADDAEQDGEALYDTFNEQLLNALDISFISGKGEEVQTILGNSDYNKTTKTEKLMDVLNCSKSETQKVEFIKLLSGRKVDAGKLYPELELEEKVNIEFGAYNFEDKVPEIQEAIGDEYMEIIDTAKAIYDKALLSAILETETYLSFARVKAYEKHHNDLKLLKSMYAQYKTKDDYDRMFRSEEEGTYSAYVNSYNAGSKNRRNMKARDKEALYATIRKDFKGIEDENIENILIDMEKGNFLPKQRTAGNGVIPNQVHKIELKKILSNAESYLQFLQEQDESGLTVSERILALFSFQIPYYIGPTSENSAANGGTGWVVRKEKGVVLPWNISQKIDIDKTSEAFIENLIRECTYINGEQVMPKCSMEYEAYCVLNEINNIKIDGNRIEPHLKQAIYNDLFKRGKKVTKSQLVNYLIGAGVLTSESQLTGLDTAINSSLSSYGKMYAIFGDNLEKDSYKEYAEEIIRLGTIYGGAKPMFKKRLDRFVEQGIITETQEKRILGYKFKDWGRFSKQLIELQGIDKSTGEVISLIRAMWEYNLNFMELIYSSDFTFREAIEERKTASIGTLAEIQIEDLDEFYFSAPVKRMVWQTILIIREITEIMGNEPTRVFVEMTRNEDEYKERKQSRGKQLCELYKAIKDDRNWEKEIKEADASGRLRSKKLYLYYTQMGRCMYTGERIELTDLFDNNLYDIDHIYPRHYVKDDNITNNLVLVKKQANAYKSDNYPIAEETRFNPQVRELWSTLHQSKLISDEKYSRLTGNTPFSDDQKEGFIARQLVETSQGAKSVATLLKQLLPANHTTIVYAKASNVSDFRRDFDLPKSRLVNDFHHAHDAYLNIVVGNVYYTKFTHDIKRYLQEEAKTKDKNQHYNLGKMYAWDIVRDGKTAWRAGEAGTIKTVKNMISKNTPMMTRMNFEAHGSIGNATLYSARKATQDAYIPLKSNDSKMQDVTKYGGYNSISVAYYFLVEHGTTGKRIRTIEPVPIYLKEKIEGDNDGLIRYCKDTLGLIDPDIRLKKIKIQSLCRINGYYVHISGRTGNHLLLRNAVNLCLKPSWTTYVKKLEKYQEKGIVDQMINEEQNILFYQTLKEKHVNGIYAKRPNAIGEIIKRGEQVFTELPLTDQCDVLVQLLLLSAIGTTTANLKQIGGAGMAGKMCISKKVSKASEFILINQSITGIYENKVDLLTV